MTKTNPIRIGLSVTAAGWLFMGWILALSACSSRQETAAPAAGAVEGPVETMTVRAEVLPVRREATGIVVSATEATLASRGAGAVLSMRVEEGDRVRKGDVLVELDRRELEALLSGAKAEADNAAVRFDRMKALFSTESVTRQELDDAERAFKTARAGQTAFEARLSDQTLRAPFDGVVTEKQIEVGEMAAPGRPLLRLVDDRRFRLEASVPESEIGYLQTGGRVAVRLDALEDIEEPGTIAQIVPSSDPATHSFLVKVDLQSRPALKTGLFGRVVYEAGARKTVRVPRGSVMTRGALSSVYVVGGDGVIRSRLIRTGTAEGEGLEVLSGVREDERIVLHPVDGLEGKKIEGNRDPGR